MDLRVVSFNVPPQEVLTRDSVTVTVDAVTYFRIHKPIELLLEREAISHSIQQVLDHATEPWGVKVERVEIKDVRLPPTLQRAMAAEAEASREARAKVWSSI